MFIVNLQMGAVIPVLIGGSLLYLAFNRGRVAALVFGHTCIVVGAYLITWGIFSLMGGVCAIFHGFCRCVTKQVDNFEQIKG